MNQTASTREKAPLLVADDLSPSSNGALAHRTVLRAVARRSLPQIAEVTLAPALLFYVMLRFGGAAAAMISVLVWTYVAVLRRVVRGVRLPTILWLGAAGLTCRTVVGLVSGSTFAYFVQPIATTVVLGGLFLGSVFVGRPLVARLAHDFCPLSPDVAARPAVVRLFVWLTLLWSFVHILTAAATFGMLVTMPVGAFVAIKTVTCLTITAGAVVVTVCCSIRTARSERLMFAGALR